MLKHLLLFETRKGRREIALPLPPIFAQKLLTNTQLLDDSTVSLNICLHQIVEEVTSVTNHLEQTSSGVVILLVGLKMFGKVADSLGEDSDLNLGRTCVGFAQSVLFDNSGFLVFLHHSKTPLIKYFPVAKQSAGVIPRKGANPESLEHG